MEGINAAQYSGTSFTDTEAGQWYSAAVEWASQNGIVLGVGDGRFDPDGQVTREQMAAILYRYAKYGGVDVSGADSSRFHSFRDAGQVADYAKEPMVWAVSKGIMQGTPNGLEPQAQATRAQVAQMIYNFSKLCFPLL